MLKIIAQYENHNGPTATGEHKIKFAIQKEFAANMYEVLKKLEKSPNVMLYIDVMESKQQADEIAGESDEQKQVRLNKKIHVLFDEIAQERDVTKSAVKDEIKRMMIGNGTIKTSLKELSLEKQLDLINDLEAMLIEEKYEQ